MNEIHGNRWLVSTLCAALAFFATSALFAQAPPPLPDGFMRAPEVPAGMAPKMRVTETNGTVHVFDASFSPGDEIVSGLTDLAIEHHITSGYVTGLGGLSGALLAWGDPEINAFQKIPVDEKCELISLLGHIAMRDGKPYVHLHAVVGFRDGTTKAGHVMEAHVAPIAEISVVATSIGGAAH